MGMWKLALPLAVAIAAPGVAAGSCSDLSASIEASEKTIALENVRGILDNSAPRETNRLQRIANQLASINANLLLMDRAKCTLPLGPMDAAGGVWKSAALDCVIASQRNSESDDAKQKCNQGTWKSKTAKTD